MRKSSLLYLLPLLLTVMACAKERRDTDIEGVMIQTKSYEAHNDSTLYGLACEGCNDTVLVLLPDSGGDPIYLNIVRAMRAHQVFGRPEVGDYMAVMVHPDNRREALSVIDMEQLQGTWVYWEMPTRKRNLSQQELDSLRHTMDESEFLRIDSMVQSMMQPREYGYNMKHDHTVMPVGGPPRTTSLDEETPVVYPPLKWYNEWNVCNGKLIFTSGGMSVKENKTTTTTQLSNDTAELVLLRRDSLVLRFGDTVRGFRLKTDSASVKGN